MAAADLAGAAFAAGLPTCVVRHDAQQPARPEALLVVNAELDGLRARRATARCREVLRWQAEHGRRLLFLHADGRVHGRG